MVSQREKEKQLAMEHRAPNNVFLESEFNCATWLSCIRLMWKGQILISAPLIKVNNIAPPIPIIVPNTLALPAAALKFNFSKLQKIKQN